AGGVDADTPLLEWGILNSMNTAKLLTFVREELGVEVPVTRITGRDFGSLRAITDLVHSLGPTRATSPARD
ncbi:phosphopantetheine-binding protein, partial [Streptomyces sp. URMC 129]|uniref:phosphopantetheine-binding protein n=1 Tax=Streptomyces sp. URMC 129 TaxID=3423407 RepID=UPI003F19F132